MRSFKPTMMLTTPATRRTVAHAVAPVSVLEVELSNAIPELTSSGGLHSRALLLVRLHDEPLGGVQVEVPSTGLSADALAGIVWNHLGAAINHHLNQDGITLSHV